jgi:hypothetical protein
MRSEDTLMKHIFLCGLAVAALIAGFAVAEEPTLGGKLGTTPDEVAAALEAEGYAITRYER